MSTAIPETPAIEYPDSDGMPMADNDVQFRYIVTIKGGLDALYRDDPNIYVAGDHLWYPVLGHPEIRSAPDVYVAFGRPKGDRGSYKQWEENGVAPQVVFEILSPVNRTGEMERKFDFYERYGVEEYYVFDPDSAELKGWWRQGAVLRPVAVTPGFVSPRLRVRLEVEDGELRLYGPDGRRFLTFVELAEQEEAARQAQVVAEYEAAAQRQRAEQERQRAEQERQRAEQERQRAEQERQRAERYARLLRDAGIEPPA